MTDVSDVVFEKDPFEFMSKTESRYDLWVGSEKMAGSLASSRWMIAKYKVEDPDCVFPSICMKMIISYLFISNDVVIGLMVLLNGQHDAQWF